jgi:glycosyltransferase involved in cell wall biosynthesis
VARAILGLVSTPNPEQKKIQNVKVLFDHPNPFLLAHGGFQIQIEQTRSALQNIGVNVEFLRWWDCNQSGQVIHFFGRPPASYVEFAHAKGIKIVIGELLGGLAARPPHHRLLQRILIQTTRRILPPAFTAKLAWDTYSMADAVIALTRFEADLMIEMFGAPRDKVFVVPNGVESVFIDSPKTERGKWLVCTATITERKRILELAQAAIKAQTPLWVIGRAYADGDPYFATFRVLQAAHPAILRFEGAIEDRSHLARIYREAHGFVLLSSMESLSLSALEASACACPLLLSDLPWAKSAFGKQATYCPLTDQTEITARHLREFYDSPNVPPPPPRAWDEVAAQLKGIYDRLLNTSL